MTTRPKVTVKLVYDNPYSSSQPPSRPPSRSTISRPPSHGSPIQTSLRPKAKVNSSATPTSVRKPPVISSKRTKSPPSGSAVARANPTPRPASPAKQTPHIRDGTLSPTFQPNAGTTPKSSLRSSTPTPAPEFRHRSDLGHFNSDKRTRNGSVSLHHAMSFSSLQGSNSSSVASYSPPPTPTESALYSDHERSHSPSIRIKSKVTGMAKAIGSSLSPPSSFPSHPTARIAKHRARTPSVSSNASFPSSPPSQPPVFYPITTATPAANPHRFASARPSPHKPIHRPYPSHFPPDDDVRVDYGQRNAFSKVDPANIPLPANSPPASSVSFSSHSSLSRSSPSHTTDSVDSHTDQPQDIEKLRSTLDTLLSYSEMESKEDDLDRETESQLISADRKVEAEAKSIRKIADLEITNRSLLAINASLETAKDRQAKEIRELRRKLRESRLILPPRAYRAVKSSTDPDDKTDEEENADDVEEDEGCSKDGDQVYQRIKLMLEGLLESGRRALETTTADFSQGAKGVAKVLSAEEVRTWRDSSGSIPDHETPLEHEAGHPGMFISPSRGISLPDKQNLELEEQVEVLPNVLSLKGSTAPPILITESP